MALAHACGHHHGGATLTNPFALDRRRVLFVERGLGDRRRAAGASAVDPEFAVELADVVKRATGTALGMASATSGKPDVNDSVPGTSKELPCLIRSWNWNSRRI
jgi:hypothetical protein